MMKNRCVKASLCGMMLVLVTLVVCTTNVNALEPPVADADGPYVAYECDEIWFDALGSYDPDYDALFYRWDFNGDGMWDTNWDESPISTHIWLDEFQGYVVLEVTDGVFTDSDSAEVSVSNIDPEIIDIYGPTDPVETGTEVSVTATFFDGNMRSGISSADTFIATFDWGDGIQSFVALPVQSQIATGNHVYSEPGVYTVTITVTDDDGGSSTGTYSFIVVYEANVEPGTGFVTGGGWVNSEPGMYRPDPTISGRANFGFVAKYKKGQQIPTGNTEFNFQMANLNFHSSDYDWLIVSGNRAKYKGSGTINGEGDYGFMLTGVDGGNNGDDAFRIKIWDKSTGEMIYDNNDDTILGGGEIVIHRT